MVGVTTTSSVYAATLTRKASAAVDAAVKVATAKLSGADFSVTTPIEDYLPQSHPSTKKTFKNHKDYIAYLMLLMQKIDKIKPNSGSFSVHMEDRNLLSKLENEFKSLIADNT